MSEQVMTEDEELDIIIFLSLCEMNVMESTMSTI